MPQEINKRKAFNKSCFEFFTVQNWRIRRKQQEVVLCRPAKNPKST